MTERHLQLVPESATILVDRMITGLLVGKATMEEARALAGGLSERLHDESSDGNKEEIYQALHRLVKAME